MLTVEELIERLQQLPPDDLVVTRHHNHFNYVEAVHTEVGPTASYTVLFTGVRSDLNTAHPPRRLRSRRRTIDQVVATKARERTGE